MSFRDCTLLFPITVRTSCPLHGQQLLVVPHCLLVLLIVLVPEEEAAIHTYVHTNSYVVERIYSIPGPYLLYTTINPSFPPLPPPHTHSYSGEPLYWYTVLSMWEGLQTVSSLYRCRLFRVSFIERFHCILNECSRQTNNLHFPLKPLTLQFQGHEGLWLTVCSKNVTFSLIQPLYVAANSEACKL